MENSESKIYGLAGVGWQVGDPGEPVLQIKSKDSLLSLSFREAGLFALYRLPADLLRPIRIMEDYLLYPKSTNLNASLIQNPLQVDTYD